MCIYIYIQFSDTHLMGLPSVKMTVGPHYMFAPKQLRVIRTVISESLGTRLHITLFILFL